MPWINLSFGLGHRLVAIVATVEDGEVIRVHVGEIVFAGGEPLFEGRNIRCGAKHEAIPRALLQELQYRPPALQQFARRLLRHDAEAERRRRARHRIAPQPSSPIAGQPEG